MTMIPQKDVYKRKKKKKRVYTETIIEVTDYKELFERILKKKKRENGKEKVNYSYKEAIILTAYTIIGEEGNLKNPKGWIKLDL